jgi:hypothetical protein
MSLRRAKPSRPSRPAPARLSNSADLGRPVPQLTEPEAITPPTDPTALLRSLGAPPVPGNSVVAALPGCRRRAGGSDGCRPGGRRRRTPRQRRGLIPRRRRLTATVTRAWRTRRPYPCPVSPNQWAAASARAHQPRTGSVPGGGLGTRAPRSATPHGGHAIGAVLRFWVTAGRRIPERAFGAHILRQPAVVSWRIANLCRRPRSRWAVDGGEMPGRESNLLTFSGRAVVLRRAATGPRSGTGRTTCGTSRRSTWPHRTRPAAA